MHFCLTNMESKNSFSFHMPNFRFTSKILIYNLKLSAVNRVIHRNDPSVIFLPKKKVTGEFTKQNHLCFRSVNISLICLKYLHFYFILHYKSIQLSHQTILMHE